MKQGLYNITTDYVTPLRSSRCLPDSDPECPTCARQFAVIREVRRNQVALAERHDLFLSEVQDAEDGFAVVAGAFGRGLFEKQLRDVPSS